MKFLHILLILILFLPFSSASIEIMDQLDDEYNLGDNIEFSIKIIPDETITALIKLTLKCTEKEVPYYVAPIELNKGKEIIVETPPIKAFSEGLCNIRVNVESLEGEDLEGITSKEFTVTDRLELSVTVDKTDVFPGDKIKIEGSASKGGEIIEDGNIIVKLGNKKVQIALDGKDFIYELELDDNIKSGEHTIIVEVNDSYGNYNEEGIIVVIEAVPTTLELNLNKKEFKPKEIVELIIDLLDQAGDIIEGNVDVLLFKEKTLLKDEIVIFDKQIEANKEFSFTFNYSTPPNDYVLKSNFGELENKETITILPYPKIEMKVVGDTVFIKNVGNIKFNNETSIVLEKDDKTYFINKKIKLDVDEETTIDLSKEVPSGNYTVTLPAETVIEEKVVEKIVEKEVPKYIEKEVIKTEEKVVESEEEVSSVIENVAIQDNRPFYKKGLSFITGAIIAGAGLLLSRPRLASFLMIIIILSIVGYFNRKRIERIIEKIREKRTEKL